MKCKEDFEYDLKIIDCSLEEGHEGLHLFIGVHQKVQWGIAPDEPEEPWKAEIDAMSYEDMLRKWRFEPTGSGYFTTDDPRTDYFMRTMEDARAADPTEAVRASKAVGWGH